jgi:hypothetical protein
VKFVVETSSVTTVVSISVKELTKDVINSKLKAYG